MSHFKKLLFCIAGICLFQFSAISQNYPQNYFRNPLNIPIQLAASFGELRPDHFHMGLDIRTQGRENLPVHAAAEGYISRIIIQKYGFGRALMITHPNGYTTLYAHLNNFTDAVEKYLKEKQYKEQRWEQDFQVPAELFPVKKGQFIAYSGNTGGSQGPHLHFEIRDTETGNNLNPQLFGFNIPDNTPPIIQGLYWFDRRFSTYQLASQQIGITKKNGIYTAAAPVAKVGSPLISLGIQAEDRSAATPFRLGIYQAELWMDDSLLFAFRLDDFSYTDSRYVNACIDYSRYKRNKTYVTHLAMLPGNHINIYSEAGGPGVVILADTLVHKIRILAKDVNGNKSDLNFNLQFDPSMMQDHYFIANSIPLQPDKTNYVESENAKISFPKYSFYDMVPFVISEQPSLQASPLIGLQNDQTPVHESYTVQVKSYLKADDPLKEKTVMQFMSGTSKLVTRGNWTGDWMEGKWNRLGNVQLMIDTIPPVITPVGWNNGSKFSGSKRLILRGKDNLSGIASFTGLLDGKWLLFSKKNDDFIYEFDANCGKGRHELIVTAIDQVGNKTERKFSFIKE